MQQNSSFHIYDSRKDYSVTNIRDILFGVDRKEVIEDAGSLNLRPSRSQLSLIGKGGCGVRHFVAVNLALAYANIMINSMSFVVAIPAMLNHTAIKIHVNNSDPDYTVDIFEKAPFIGSPGGDCPPFRAPLGRYIDGPFDWPDSALFISVVAPQLGFVAATLPAAILAKRCGAKNVLATGLLVQSLLQMMIPAAAETGFPYFWILLLVQNIAMAPSLPCTYMLLSNWIPPCERSRMVAVVGCGLPIAVVTVHYLGGTICQCELCGGWAAHFYFFSASSLLLSMFFAFFMWEDPEICPVISDRERNFIQNELNRFKRLAPVRVPWMKLARSLPCWALWASDIGESIYMTTLVIIVPYYILQVLNNSQEYDFLELLLPGVLLVVSSLASSVAADCLIMRGKLKTVTVRKLFNSLALFGTAVGVSVVSHTGCNTATALFIHNITALLNGVNTSGFRVNYLELSQNFSGILVSIGKTLAVLACILWTVIFGLITLTGKKSLRKWQLVFFIAAIVLASSATIFNCFASSYRQHWDFSTRFVQMKGRYSVTFTTEVDGDATPINVKCELKK